MPWAAYAFSARAMISAFDDTRLVNRFVEAIPRESKATYFCTQSRQGGL
jgi:hypothetical protein